MDYQAIPALLPATFTPLTQVLVIDIDGDNKNEMVVLSPDIGQLAVIHQFTFNQLSPNDWQDQTPHWWNLWTSPQQGTVPGGWTVQRGDVMLAADFNGDGVDELFLYNTTTLQWGIVQWNSVTNSLQTTCYQPNGCPNWTPQTGDTFVIFPNPPGQTTPALLAYNTASTNLAVLQYSNGAWSCPVPPTSGKIDNWTFDDATHFFPGKFGVEGQGFLLFDSSDGYVAFLSWDGKSFHVTSGQNSIHGTNGTWNVRTDDVFLVGDLDGDGADEVIVYNPAGYLGVWNSAPAQFLCLAATSSIANWTIGSQDQYRLVPVQGHCILFGYNSATMQVSLLSLPNGFQCDYVRSSLDPTNPWPVSSIDRYYSAAPTSLTAPALFAVSPQPPVQGEDPVATLIALSATDGGTSANTSINVLSSVPLPAPGWTPTLLVQAPHRGFPAFSSSQQPVYAYVSNLFPEVTNGAIRNFYTTAEWAGKFAAFSDFLKTQANPPGQSFDPGDWADVCGVIEAECNCVDTIYTAYNVTIPNLASNFAQWQTDDLTTVMANIQNSIPPTTPSSFDYWFAQATVATLWGIAAAVGGASPALGAIGSVLASLLGSKLSEQQPNSNPLQVAYDQVESVLTQTFLDQAIANSVAPSALLSDAIKMRIFDELSGTTWNLPAVGPQTQAAFEAADRRTMYSELMPCVFEIAVINGSSSNAPGSPLFNGSNPNPNSYSATPAQGNLWNLNVLYAIVNGRNLPSAVLTNDLIAIGVSMPTLLAGTGMWSGIPRTVL